MFSKDNFSIYLLNHWLSWNGLLALCDFNMFTLERKRILNKLWIIDRTSYGVILLKSHLVWMNQFHTTVFFSFSFFLLFLYYAIWWWWWRRVMNCQKNTRTNEDDWKMRFFTVSTNKICLILICSKCFL